MKPIIKKLVTFCLASVLSLALLGAITVIAAYVYVIPTLPDIDTLKDVQLQVPLRVYASKGELIAEFGEMKRTPLKYEEFPKYLIQAVLAAEDDRFFEHPGVDYQGILRAAYQLVRTGERAQGGSTITMQVARNFFLSPEKTFLRKINEIFLSFKIEGALSKEDILALYLNKIYLGKRSYGFAAAAQVYYGKKLQDLSLAEIAMIAGLPKAPSSYNPVVAPERALLRRDYILGRMHYLEFISDTQLTEARAIPVHAGVYSKTIDVNAPYVAEMVRNEMFSRYGQQAYTAGYEVITTIDARLQKAANTALRKDLLAYDRRHGYRGIIKHVELLDDIDNADDQTGWLKLLDDITRPGNLVPALVISVEEEAVYAFTGDAEIAYMPWEQLSWARTYIDENHLGPKLEEPSDVLSVGDIIYVTPAKPGCSWLAQIPRVAGALVSLRSQDGATEALVGGFDYYHSKF
ncbi:MAG: transglycosylase domain-containing protein, partial [Gammaproteobacteria bacterium]|nr:transglycosylase domain-containing protein [Gammaproteobacteria bacterium]